MRDQQGFADFAAARSASLRRQAYLLTGSVPGADRVLDRALADTGKRWDRLGSAAAAESHARRLVAAAAVRSRGAVPAVALTPLGTALPTDDAGEAVWRALAGLPPRRRAVLVLRYDEGLSDAGIAERLGVPAAAVDAEGDAGLATLRSLLRRRGAPEDLLPTALAARGADLPTQPAPADPDADRSADPDADRSAGPEADRSAAAEAAPEADRSGGPEAGPEADRSGGPEAGPEADRSGGPEAGPPASPEPDRSAGPGVDRSGGADRSSSPQADPSGGVGVRSVGRGGGRLRWGIVAAGVLAVVVLVVAVVVPALRDDPVAAAAGAVPARQGDARGELPWAGRGPLVGDDGLLRDALRTWQDGVPARQRPTGAAVLYAGAPDGARTVLLQGTDGTGQSWVAEVSDAGGPLALRTTEPLGRAVPLLALAAGGRTRLLAPPDPDVALLTRDAGTMTPLTLDADGLSEPVTPPAEGLPVVVTARGQVPAGSGRVRPGRLSAVTGTVELAPDTLGLGTSAVTATWYDDGDLLARRLGGAVTVAGLGPVRTTAITIGGRSRRLDARAYEAVQAGNRFLATVVRVDGKAVCVATSAPGAAGTAGTDPADPLVLVSRCLPAPAAAGIVQAVATGGVRSVRLRLAPAAKGKPARIVAVTGSSGSGLVGLAKVRALPARAVPGEARNGAGALVARLTAPAYQPR